MTTAALPGTPEAVTPALLTRMLRERNQIGDAAITSVRSEPVGQGVGILCQLARLTLEYDQAPDTAPRTMILKIPSSDPQTRGLAVAFQFYERETRFYMNLAGRISLPTPRCYYSAFDAGTGDFMLLLEDLASARIGDQLAGCSVGEAELAIRELARMHTEWWDKPALDELNWMPQSSDPINKAGLSLYPMAWPPFVQKLGRALPQPVLQAGEKLGGRLGSILDRFTTGPRTICHGDFRLDNMFFAAKPGDKPLTVIDWQIASRGVGTYDIGYFMTQSLDIEVRRASEMDLLKLYHQLLVDGGVKSYSFDQLLDHYRWTVLFCFAYPVMGGGLGDLSNARGLALATAMMNRSVAAILDWRAFELLDA